MSELQQQINSAIAAHSMWKTRLQQAIATGTSEFNVATVKLDNQCAFGKWLHTGVAPEDQRSEEYHKVRALHAAFHQAAAKVLADAVSGRTDEAKKGMAMGSPYAHASAELTKLMLHWRQQAA